jgi:(p)ppGpp synthase/HD superfamily hydrolase
MKASEATVLAVQTVIDAYGASVDRNGFPKLMHLFNVAEKFNDDPATYVIALIHDLQKDFPQKAQALLAQYPPEVSETIDVLTQRDGESYQSYVKRVIDSDNTLAIMVKMADITANIHRTKRQADKDIEDKAVAKYERAGGMLAKALVLKALTNKIEEKADLPDEEDSPVPEGSLLAPSSSTLQ